MRRRTLPHGENRRLIRSPRRRLLQAWSCRSSAALRRKGRDGGVRAYRDPRRGRSNGSVPHQAQARVWVSRPSQNVPVPGRRPDRTSRSAPGYQESSSFGSAPGMCLAEPAQVHVIDHSGVSAHRRALGRVRLRNGPILTGSGNRTGLAWPHWQECCHGVSGIRVIRSAATSRGS